MECWILLASLASLAAAAPSEEVTVWGDRVEQAWAELDRTLAGLGYVGHVRGERTVYKATGADRWKPRLVVDHDGWTSLRSPQLVLRTVSIGALGLTDGDRFFTPYSGPSATGATLDFHFWMTSGGVLRAQERALVGATAEPLRELNDALADHAFQERLADLDAALTRLWDHGETPGGEVLDTREERREALLELWATRTDTPEGDAVREVVETFLRRVVQASAWPVTEAEAIAAALRCPCERAPAL